MPRKAILVDRFKSQACCDRHLAMNLEQSVFFRKSELLGISKL